MAGRVFWYMLVLTCSFYASSAGTRVAGTTVQIPFHRPTRTPSRQWNEPLSQDATGHLIFSSVASLLQMAPNSKYIRGEPPFKPVSCSELGGDGNLLHSQDTPSFEPPSQPAPSSTMADTTRPSHLETGLRSTQSSPYFGRMAWTTASSTRILPLAN